MKKRILVVDDDPVTTLLTQATLERTGLYDIRTENQGRKAIETAREFRPDLILLDVMMPGMLGSEIAVQLQADPELRTTKFIFLTGVVTKSEEQRSAGQIGGHTFIAKTFNAADLCRVVADHLRQQDGR